MHTYVCVCVVDALKKNSLVKFANYHIFIKQTKFPNKAHIGKALGVWAIRWAGASLYLAAFGGWVVCALVVVHIYSIHTTHISIRVPGNHRRATLTSLLILLKIIL